MSRTKLLNIFGIAVGVALAASWVVGALWTGHHAADAADKPARPAATSTAPPAHTAMVPLSHRHHRAHGTATPGTQSVVDVAATADAGGTATHAAPPPQAAHTAAQPSSSPHQPSPTHTPTSQPSTQHPTPQPSPSPSQTDLLTQILGGIKLPK